MTSIHPDARNIGNDDRERTRQQTRHQHRWHADLRGFWFCFAQGKANWDEITAHLWIDGEESRKSILRRNVAQANLHAQQCTDHLRDHRSRSEQRREYGNGADDRNNQQTKDVRRQGRERMRNDIAYPRIEDDTNDHTDEGHERENIANDLLDRVASRLIEGTDNITDATTDNLKRFCNDLHGYSSSPPAIA